MRARDELIDRIVSCSQIPSARRRRETERELRAHMEDFADAAREAGHQEDVIETLVMTHFGDPREVAGDFAWVYRNERRRILVFSYAVSTVLIASCLMLALLIVQTGLAASLRAPIVKVFASRHTVIEGLDVLACVAVYLAMISLESCFTSHRFLKAATTLTGVIAFLVAGFAAARWHGAFLIYGLIAGVFLRAARLFVVAKTIRAGIVFFCFVAAGLGFAIVRSPVSWTEAMATCASWFAVGVGYLLMTEMAPRVSAAFRTALERIA